MNSIFNIHTPLSRNGTNKSNRLSPYLSPDYVAVEERTLEDHLDLVRKLAREVKLLDSEGQEKNWEQLFQQKDYTTGHYPPHYALIIAFLRLLQVSQQNLNTLSKRHLDFFYQEVLQFSKNQEVPDSAHLTVTLAQSVDQYLLKKGTLFKAGKDAQGNDLHYSLIRDTSFSKAELTDVRTLYLDQYKETHVNDEGKPQEQTFNKTVHGNTLVDSSDKALTDLPIWPALGDPTLDYAQIGFAISSPILFLEEGDRKVTVKIRGDYFGNEQKLTHWKAQRSSDDFSCYLTTSSGWLNPSIVDQIEATGGEGETQLTIEFSLTINRKDPAIVAYDPQIHGDKSTSFPVLKVVLDPEAESEPYNVLRHLAIARIDLRVDVTGVTNLILQNDESSIDPSQPFLPFGSAPTRNSNFYIGSQEVFYKTLNYFTLNFEWHDKPESLKEHYQAYQDSMDRSDDEFRVEISILDDKTWKPLKEPNKQAHLFYIEPDPEDENEIISFDTQNIQIKNDEEDSIDRGDVIQTNDLQLDREIKGQTIEQYDLKTLKGFIKLSLEYPDFGHKEYPIQYASAINENYRNTQSPDATSGQRELPKIPYTPTLRGLTIDYSSEVSIENDSPVEQIYHIHPFGWSKHDEVDETGYLLPQYNHEGNLYLGIAKVRPDQEVTILFQVAEATANPDVDIPNLEWSYLSDNQWLPIEPNSIFYNSTNNLNIPGLFTFKIPSRFHLENTILPRGKFWLKASAINNALGVCKVIDIRTQGALVTFKNQNNTTEHLAAPLPSDQIRQLLTLDPQVKKVEQPFASFGGKSKESDQNFNQRVSERLRHKDRAITLWDYEHLLLEKFPGIYKAKAFKHSSLEKGATVGNILIITIPEVRNHEVINPFQPMASLSMLTEIENYLGRLTPPNINIEVKNPLYEEIEVSFLVKFRDGFNRGLYEKQLEENIKKFLSPWAYEEGKDISFGGSIYKSTLLNFVEEQPFVDFVTFFRMDQYDTQGNVRSNIEEAIATTPISVLVSAGSHQITVLEDDRELCADGIGYMIVEETFTLIK